MAEKTSHRQADAIASPEIAFETPADIAHRLDLTLEEKLQVLAQWEQDVHARLAATSEGMPANDVVENDLDLIKEITKVAAALQKTGAA